MSRVLLALSVLGQWIVLQSLADTPAASRSGNSFRFVQLGDTQYVTNCLEQWTNTIDYLLAQKPQTVFQPGDLADGAYESEYVAQTNQLWRLVAAGIPLFSIPGNHDVNRTNWEKFMTPLLLAQPNIAETFAPGQTYDGLVMTQSFGGVNFVYIGNGPYSYTIPPVLKWMQNMSAKYHDRTCIFVTHGYLARDGGGVQSPSDPYYEGGDVLERNFQAMTNIEQVLCGHEIVVDPNFYGPSVHHVSRNEAGNAFHGLMFNFQISPPYVGDAVLNGFRKVAGVTWVRWYTWFPDANLIEATTWENYGKTNRTTADCQFSFPIWQTYSNALAQAAESSSGFTDSMPGLTNQLELCVPIFCDEDTNALRDFSYHHFQGVALSNNTAQPFPRVGQYITNSELCALHQADGYSAVRFGDVSDFGGFSNLTVSAWVRTAVDGVQYLIDKHNGGTLGQWMLQEISAQKLRFFVITTDGRVNQDVTVPNIADGAWHHLAATYDGTKQEVFFDGISVGTVPQSGKIAANADRCLYLGGYSSGGKQNWIGEIREVNIWSRALSPNDIAQLFNSRGSVAKLLSQSPPMPVSSR